jgi:aminoglycoside phosphotransferase (APT) family kinase protein
MARNLDRLCASLATLLPDGDRITGLSLMTTGHSNETFVIDGLGHILRLPPSSAPLLSGHGIIAQAQIYQQMAAALGAPLVPKVIHLCEDAQPLGDPFFVMECVAGDSVNDYQLPDWFTASTPEARSVMCADWVGSVGCLARLSPLEAFGKPVSPEDEARGWQKIAAAADCPELAALFDRLLAMPAPCSGPISPVHGDCKIANMMFADGRLTAVLDWELGYNGEPLADLGYLLFFFANEDHGPARASALPGMWHRGDVIAAWEAASGRSASGVLWYEVSQIGKIAAIIANGYQIYASGGSDDPRFLNFKAKRDENILIMEAMIARLEAADNCGM